jgi:hypothetical protein
MISFMVLERARFRQACGMMWANGRSWTGVVMIKWEDAMKGMGGTFQHLGGTFSSGV